MRTRSILLATALAAALAAPAVAGLQYTTGGVTLDDAYRYASGTLSDVRHTADSVQYIGCQAIAAASPYMRCDARDASGRARSCYTSSPAFIAMAQSVAPDAQVSFWWDDYGSCTYANVSHYSNQTPF